MKSVLNEKLPVTNILIILGLLITTAINTAFVFNGLDTLQDFGSFYASGQLANEGKNPYSTGSPFMFTVDFKNIPVRGDAPNLNPPVSVPAFQWMARFDPLVAANTWRGISVLLFALSLIILYRSIPLTGSRGVLVTAWACSTAAFWHTLQLGQVYCLLLLLAVVIWDSSKKSREVLAGIALGILIAIKPNFVYWAFVLLAARYWKTFLAAGFTGLGLSLSVLPFKGVEIYRQWLEASALYTPGLLLFPGNNSFQGLTARILQPGLGSVLSVFLGLTVLWCIFRNRPSLQVTNGLGILVSLLISPIAWTGYTLLTIPVFLDTPRWNRLYKVSAVIFSVPVIFILVFFEQSYAGFILFGWFYGWGLLTLLAALIFKPEKLTDKKPEITSSIQTN